MFKSDCGKLMVYTSDAAPHRKRLQSVSTATEKTAKLLNIGFEVVRFKKSFSQIYVYYENGENEPIPIYCDEGKTNNLQEIYATLKDMMFVLSFHPKLSVLRQMRKGLMRLS
jgi:tRNA U34 2-thiouridine synthase MnmA/TrmU